jgi:hypothetical protein
MCHKRNNYEISSTYEYHVIPKVFSFVERGLKSYFEGFKGGGVYYRILWESSDMIVSGVRVAQSLMCSVL